MTSRLEQLELMRQKFLAEVRQFLTGIPEGEIKVEIDLYPEEPDLLRQLEEEAAGLGWIPGTNMGHRWYSSSDVVAGDAIDTGGTTVYL
jgi:flagellar biosynthesis/type III secretory pathway protein FliH